ncbi:MAG TPA: CHAT domain-containing tetratricopeptide repeat protein, partial [Bryobacteraceae bacterium]|nr:CHAT domain-containing tetratricopeptide repeat protein [Bryobacteraceae bacterium]
VLLLSGQENAVLAILDAAEAPPSPQLRARQRMDQGQACSHLHDFQRAEKLFEEAHALAEASALPLLVGEIEMRQGPLFVQTDRFDDGVATLRHALEAATRGEDSFLQANVMGNLGYLLSEKFRYDEAIYWLQHAQDVFTRLGASHSAANAVGNLAWCYYRLGDTEKALANFEEAISQSASAGDRRSEQIWLGDSGNVYLDVDDFPAAIDRYKRALAIAKERKDRYWSVWWLGNLALAAINSGRLDDAEQYNNEAFATNKDPVNAREDLYNRLYSGRIAAGRKQFARAEELFRTLEESASEDPTPALEARGALADLFIQTGDATKAEAQFRSAIATVESRQAGLTKEDYKLSYLSSLVHFYQDYVDFLVERGETAKALDAVESSRARILTEGAKSRAVVQRIFNASGLQALARSSHRIFLSYWLAPKQSYVWAITPAKIELFKLPPEKEIRSLVESYRTAIEDLRDPIESHHPAGEKLSQVLLGPVRALVPAGSRVTVVPDGALHSLNFEILPALSDPSKYWIEDVTLSVAPSLGLLLNSRNARKAGRPSLLAIGDPEPAGQEYPRLPNARQEVDQIAALFSASNKAVYEGAESRPSCYRQASPAHFSLIHFAAHATANRASPLDSALILSREGNAYTLSARDIMNVPLDADLVTLSSCRSAGARAYSGEGLVGLTWAFQQAGARRVIAGLWDVNDESTSMLMKKLYSGLASGVAPEDALRAAKLSLLHAAYPYRKPYYWGPFQLYSGT